MIHVVSYVGSGAGEASHTKELSDRLAEALGRGEEVAYECLTARELRISFCRSCNACFGTGSCPLDDVDDVGDLKRRLLDAWDNPATCLSDQQELYRKGLAFNTRRAMMRHYLFGTKVGEETRVLDERRIAAHESLAGYVCQRREGSNEVTVAAASAADSRSPRRCRPCLPGCLPP